MNNFDGILSVDRLSEFSSVSVNSNEENKEKAEVSSVSELTVKLFKPISEMNPSPRWIYPVVQKITVSDKNLVFPFEKIAKNARVSVLTGETYLGKKVSASFEELFHISSQVLSLMKPIRSPNFLARNDAQYRPNTIQKAKSIRDIAERRLEHSVRVFDTFVDGELSPEFFFYVKRVIKERIGNCGELSQVFIYYIKQIAPSLKAETVEYENGDHVFVVLNRGCNGQSDKAIFVDPWTGSVLMANSENLPQDYLGSIIRHNKKNQVVSCPIVSPYKDEQIEFLEYR